MDEFIDYEEDLEIDAIFRHDENDAMLRQEEECPGCTGCMECLGLSETDFR